MCSGLHLLHLNVLNGVIVVLCVLIIGHLDHWIPGLNITVASLYDLQVVGLV